MITEVINGNRPDGGQGILMKTWLFLDDEYNSARAVQESYNSLTSEVFLSRSILYERIDEATFLQEIEDTKAAFNVKVSNVLDGLLQVPMTKACIGDRKCLCRHDSIFRMITSNFISLLLLC